ncbi:MAG: hypothetical protein JW878_07475 [Methanomicrobia archaeon]|nr:hypothetical protein [Methanomicrobia archaeon]
MIFFYTAFEADGIERFGVPYETGFLSGFRLAAPSATDSKGAILIHGGFDSFIEEFYSVARYFNERGYKVIAFDGPGQGAALKRYGLPWIMYRMGETDESYFRSFHAGQCDAAGDIDGRLPVPARCGV